MPPYRSFYHLTSVQRRWPKMPTWFYLVIILVLAWLCSLASGICGIILDLLLSSFTGQAETFPANSSATGLALTLVFYFLPTFFLIAGVLRLMEKRGLVSVGMRRTGAISNYLRGVVLGLLLFGSTVLGLWGLGYVRLESSIQWASIAGSFLVLLGWIIQGAAEEVLTRGFLLQIFGRMSNSFVAIAVSSVFFAVLHVGGQGFHFLPFFNLILFSVFAALLTLYERGLWGIFAIHSIWNWAQGNLFGLQVSGYEIKSAVIFDFQEVGPDWITGGQYGPEGGLMVTIVFLIATLWVAAAYWKRLHPKVHQSERREHG